MSASAYKRMARLATHPAFRVRAARLICPECSAEFDRVPSFTRHYLEHDPTLEQAYAALDGRAFRRLERSRGAQEASDGPRG